MKTLLIDGNSIMYRAYYGSAYSSNGLMKNSKGTPVNAILTFNNMISRLVSTYSPTHIFVAFDAGKKTRRHEKLESYKAGRSLTPPELIVQFPLAKQMLDLMGISRLEIKGIEADDILASMAKKIVSDDNDVFIVSSDRDLFQMVSKNISMIVPQNASKPDLIVNETNFTEIFGCSPLQVPDLKAIMGDASDNLVGVKGIGEKGALKLIQDYGSLENVYQNIDFLTKSVQSKLLESKNMAFLCRELATLDQNVEIDQKIEDITFKKQISYDLIAFFKELELNSLVKKYEPELQSNILENIVF